MSRNDQGSVTRERYPTFFSLSDSFSVGVCRLVRASLSTTTAATAAAYHPHFQFLFLFYDTISNPFLFLFYWFDGQVVGYILFPLHLSPNDGVAQISQMAPSSPPCLQLLSFWCHFLLFLFFSFWLFPSSAGRARTVHISMTFTLSMEMGDECVTNRNKKKNKIDEVNITYKKSLLVSPLSVNL